MPLNDAQARAVAVTLRVLEERCGQMRWLLSGTANGGALHQLVDDIPADARALLLQEIMALEAAIARVAAEFQLTGERRSLRRMLVGLLASSWEHLEDARPAKLGRYGPVDPQVVAPLDAGLARVIALINAMWAATQPESAAGRTLDVTR
jgi:hypothetical protein